MQCSLSNFQKNFPIAVREVSVKGFLVDSEDSCVMPRYEASHYPTIVCNSLDSVQDFPQYLMRFIKRFATGSYESASSAAAAHTTTSGIPSRDTFGFRQLIVAATTHGKVYGIDSSNGNVLWSRILGLGSVVEDGAHVVPIENKMFTVKTVGDVNGDAETAGPGVPELVLIGKRVLKSVRYFV